MITNDTTTAITEDRVAQIAKTLGQELNIIGKARAIARIAEKHALTAEQVEVITLTVGRHGANPAKVDNLIQREFSIEAIDSFYAIRDVMSESRRDFKGKLHTTSISLETLAEFVSYFSNRYNLTEPDEELVATDIENIHQVLNGGGSDQPRDISVLRVLNEARKLKCLELDSVIDSQTTKFIDPDEFDTEDDEKSV